mgnify:CR=1 FL=1
MTYEGLRLKVLKYWRVGLADWRKKQLKSTDFTIISNNCWGGMIYESYNLPKDTLAESLLLLNRKNLVGKRCHRYPEIRGSDIIR